VSEWPDPTRATYNQGNPDWWLHSLQPGTGSEPNGRSLSSNKSIPAATASPSTMNSSSPSSRLLKIAAAFALLAGLFVFTGCQTMEGAGKDIQDAGEGIEKAAK
jgi:predicted small secreted protein